MLTDILILAFIFVVLLVYAISITKVDAIFNKYEEETKNVEKRAQESIKRAERLIRKDEEHKAKMREAFSIKSQCDICGYQSMDIKPNSNTLCPMIWCEGEMTELKNGKNT